MPDNWMSVFSKAISFPSRRHRIAPRDDGPGERQPVHQVDQVMGERRLLA